jgi:hypothetical protein
MLSEDMHHRNDAFHTVCEDALLVSRTTCMIHLSAGACYPRGRMLLSMSCALPVEQI